VSETLSAASILAYAYAAGAFIGGLFPDCVIAAAAGILATTAALTLHWLSERHVDAQRRRPPHCQHPAHNEARR